MKLVMGHTIGNQVYEFPHLCPGAECAIGRFQEAQHRRTLRRAPMPRDAQFVRLDIHDHRSPDDDGPDVLGSANQAAVNVAGSLPEDRCMTTEAAVSGQPNSRSDASGCGQAPAGLEPADGQLKTWPELVAEQIAKYEVFDPKTRTFGDE